MRKILLSGPPGTGKTSTASFLSERLGFRHVNMEARGWAAKKEFYNDTCLFLGHLAAAETDVVIDWGFGPTVDMEGVSEVLAAGYSPVWLDGNRIASFRNFMVREKFDPAKEKSYYGQMHAIMDVDVISLIKPKIINPFGVDGSFRNRDEVAEEIVDASADL